MDFTQSVPIVLGAAGGGGLAIWFSKTMLTRLIAQYDKRHEANEEKIGKLQTEYNVEIRNISSQLAAFSVRVAEIASMRQDIRELNAGVAVMGAEVKKTQSDMNEAWRRIKLRAANEKG